MSQEPTSIRPQLLESLVARCLDAGDAGYEAELERLCAANPDAAADLRARIAQLQKLGFLAQQPANGTPPWLPDHVGRYRLSGLLGRGGMGVVFRGRADGEAEVAIKIIRPDLLADPRARERFRREALLVSRLSHPGICPVLEVGVDDDVPFLVMPLLQGQTFRAFLRDHREERDAVLAHVESFARALHAAHEAGLVHRDVTPGNLFVTDDDRALVFDFGLARDTTGEIATLTLSHEQLGTLPYMAPEQLSAGPRIDHRADVYSLGVVLYEALAGRLPFESEHRTELSRMILAGESPRLRRLVRELPRDLDSIVHKAIDVDPAHRYASAKEFADDLRRCREGQPVLARGVGMGVRMRRWVRHHPVAATTISLLAMMVAMAGVLVMKEQWAKEEAQHNAQLLAGKVREFDLLSGVVLHAKAVAAERRLHPALPERIPALEHYLREELGPLLDLKSGMEITLRDLEARALPSSEDNPAVDLDDHPRHAEWQQLSLRVGAMRRAAAVAAGTQTLVVPELTADQLALPAYVLNSLAFGRVAPDPDFRVTFGDEPLGLAMAREAVARSASGPERGNRCSFLGVLAWAEYTNGSFAAAEQHIAEAIEIADDEARPDFQGVAKRIHNLIASHATQLAEREAELAALTQSMEAARPPRFASDADSFLHESLHALAQRIDDLEAKQGRIVLQRLSFASWLRDMPPDHPRARHSWQEARTAIAKADGVTASRRYRGKKISLQPEDVVGLVPIGMNPQTKLWEFYDLRSAWDGMTDPTTLPIPEHPPDGAIEMGPDTGIVFVLLPGGHSVMGAQNQRPDDIDYDPDALPQEGPQDVVLSPFFLARHELTQGQWARLWEGDPERRWPSMYPVGEVMLGIPQLVTAAHPVESVTWDECMAAMEVSGLMLPTEAQWEYGCRGGSREPRYTGELVDCLAGHANLLDQDAIRFYPHWPQAGPLHDGYAGTAPVGRMGGTNAFGLYDVYGNVEEWCRDVYVDTVGARAFEDGLRLVPKGIGERSVRGGAYSSHPRHARSAKRMAVVHSGANYDLGLRAARALQLPRR